MREILFRGKRTDTGEWARGFPFSYQARLVVEGIETWDGDKHRIDPSTVGQYTGLQDRNGTRIFEGDILRVAKKMNGIGDYFFPPAPFPALCVVKWDFCAWMWEVQGKETYYIHFPDAWCHYECEVVGNVHDNPELLEEEA